MAIDNPIWWNDCDECNGTGYDDFDRECACCDGTGEVCVICGYSKKQCECTVEDEERPY